MKQSDTNCSGEGSTSDFLASLRRALEGHSKGARPTLELVETKLGPVSELAKGVASAPQQWKH